MNRSLGRLIILIKQHSESIYPSRTLISAIFGRFLWARLLWELPKTISTPTSKSKGAPRYRLTSLSLLGRPSEWSRVPFGRAIQLPVLSHFFYSCGQWVILPDHRKEGGFLWSVTQNPDHQKREFSCGQWQFLFDPDFREFLHLISESFCTAAFTCAS